MKEVSSILKGSFLNFLNARFLDKLPELIIAVIVLIIGVKVSRLINKAMKKILYKYNGNNHSLINFIIYFVHTSFLILVILICLNLIGVKTSSIVAIIGAAGISIGFALKEILGNLASALVILFFKPFNLDDYIIIIGQDVEGTVTDIQIFSTYIRTNNNKIIIVPNSMITNSSIVNVTHQNLRRMDFSFKVDIATDQELMKSIAHRIIDEEPRFEKEPKPLVGIENIDNGMFEFIVRPWIKTDLYWDVYYEIMDKFKNEFEINNIVFPRYRINSPQ